MRAAIYTLSIAVGLSIIGACNPQPEAPRLLEQARQLAEEYPDSALALIDSIFYPRQSLSRREYMRYLVAKVQTKYKTYGNISEDTLIFTARDYFTRHDNDLYKTALAYFYSGCVYREQENYEFAMLNYKNAQSYAERSADSSLMGLIQFNLGDLLSIQGLHREALESYKIAEMIYGGIADKQIRCLSAIGRMFLLLQLPDSAFIYFHKGLELAQTIRDENRQSLLAQNLSVAYSEVKQYEEAAIYLRQSFNLNQDSTRLPRYYLNFANMYSSLGKQDSVVRYIGRLKRQVDIVTDNYIKASIYSFLANWEKSNASYEEAFQYQERRMRVLEDIMAVRLKQSVYEVQQKYDYKQMQNLYYQKLLARQRWFIALLIVVVGGGTVFTVYWPRQKNRRFEAQRNIDTLREMNRDLEEAIQQKNHGLRKELLWRFDVAKKVMNLNREMNLSGNRSIAIKNLIGQFNKIVYGEKSLDELWETMLHTFNDACPGYTEKLRTKYPTLTDAEFRICVLTYAGFNVNEIALILNQSHNTVLAYRTDLRKKLGIEPRSNIAEFLNTVLN